MEFEKLKRVHLEQQTDGDVADCDKWSRYIDYLIESVV